MRAVEPRLSKYLHHAAAKKGVPLSGTFELSPCCNMDCRMCYVRKSRKEVETAGGEIPAEKWLSLAKECRNAGTLFLLLTGGEPFLYPGFRELYLELSRMGFMVSINTNGTMITEDTVSWLKEAPPARMNITLYGASDETYARLCRNPRGYTQTVNAVKLLKEAGISVKLNASMTQYNIGDLDGIYKTARELNVYVQATAYMYPPIRKNEELTGHGDRFSADEAGKWENEIDRRRLTPEQYRKRTENIRKNIIDEEGKIPAAGDAYPDGKIKNGEPLRCRAGRTSFWVNWKGEMTPCGMMVSPAAYPFRDGLAGAWEQLRKDTAQILLAAGCSVCRMKDLCSVCAASAYAETGRFDRIPEYLCHMTRARIEHTLSDKPD